jgi:carboxymethylenebutenolidase
MPRFLTALTLLAAAATAPAEVKTSTVTLKSGDEEVQAFLAEPDGKGPFPGVVVIQEWWGLNDWVKDQAKRLAGQGYVALAPDLYRGKVTDDPQIARQLLMGLPADRAVRDLKAAFATLAGRDNVRKDKVGAIGWCMGGGYALQLALNEPQLKACVICYGRVVTAADRVQPLTAAVLGVFGEEDRGIPVKGVRQFEEVAKQAGKDVTLKVYPAGHGFMREKNGDNPNPEYREGPAKEAWGEIERFFGKTLGGK